MNKDENHLTRVTLKHTQFAMLIYTYINHTDVNIKTIYTNKIVGTSCG